MAEEESNQGITNKDLLKIYHSRINPCPFCGAKAGDHSGVYFGGMVGPGRYSISCIPCTVTMMDDRPDKVIGKWNSRSQTKSEP